MHDVGYMTGAATDHDRPDWDGSAPRPLAWSAWYPTDRTDEPHPRPAGQAFDLGEVRAQATPALGTRFPVVLLSHGTGGSPESLGWLAMRLAKAGHVVIGAHHHGNTAGEAYRPEGFLCWWERATDLATLLSILSVEGPFANRLDPDRISVVGFSLGAHTALALAGAITSVDRFAGWADTAQGIGDGPREMPDAGARVPQLLASSAVFAASWARQSREYRDDRIRAVVALAPAPPVRGFDPASLARIAVPVTMITGEADTEAPSHHCADWLERCNPRFRRISVGENVGHYTFLGLPAGKVDAGIAPLFTDAPGVDRRKVHATVATAVLAALA